MTLTRPQATPVSDDPHRGPELGFVGLDVLWVQVTGTVCNIACEHCFISCAPKNDSHPVMSTQAVLDAVAEGERLGVKEYYFTGGEPFLHEDILPIIERTLRAGPLSILTNGILLTPETCRRLREIAGRAEYSLDLRVSLDGTTPGENDPVRGRHTFRRILEGAENLRQAGINPVFTVTTVHARYEGNEGRVAFMDALRGMGFDPPRVKFIPPFHIGREEDRSHGYGPGDRLSPGDLYRGEEFDLQCGSCRTVTAKGVYPCPILIEAEGARMGERLGEALHPIELNHPACVTCHVEGFSCRT